MSYALVVAVGSAGVALALWFAGAWDHLEPSTWDLRVKFFAKPEATSEKIKLILLDESSIDWANETLGLSWPWPREVYGPILDFCARAGAKTVAFDVLFVDLSVYGAEQDVALGDAIRRGVPFIGAVFLTGDQGTVSTWPEGTPPPPLEIEGLDTWLAAEDPTTLLVEGASFPIPEVRTNAHWLADVKGDQDPDGIIRRTPLFRIFDGHVVPGLGFASYLAVSNRNETVRIEPGWLHIGATCVPLDRGGRTLLRYRGPPGTYQRFTAAQIIQSELRLQEGGKPPVDPAALRDAHVFFGFSAPGLMDLRPTPLSPSAPGVEVHATLLDNLLAADSLRDTPAAWVVIFTLLISLAAAIAVITTRNARHSVAAFVVLLPLPIVVSGLAYLAGQWWPLLVGESATALALVVGVVINYATEGRQKAFIKRAFKHYLSPAVIERMLDDPSQLTLGGERRELSIFFSDLQGFSSMSERLDPKDVTALLNAYLTDMTDIVLDEGGTLDKYEGDAIIAFWNAPLDQPDHAARACRTAVRCQRKLAERREEFKTAYGAELWMRVGINTGEVVVGNMGSTERFDYTVLGDAANLAARLEGANKALGTFTMVAESTWRAAGASVLGRELGRLRVVGRVTPVRVFEPLDSVPSCAGPDAPSSRARIEAFENALKLCYDTQWQEALAAFEQMPDDPVAARYAERCRHLLAQPDERWDVIWNLTEK